MNAGPPPPEPLRSALDRLTTAGATGALRVGGAPGGTIWLVDGEIRYADTPVLPGAGERLTAAGRVSDRAWDRAYQSARLDGQVARTLVDGGHLEYAELAARVHATVYEAAHLLLTDAGAPARFHRGLRHWLGDIAGVTLADLDAEIARRQRHLDGGLAAGPGVPKLDGGLAAVAAGPDGPVVVPVVPGADDHAAAGLVDAAIEEAEEITAPTPAPTPAPAAEQAAEQTAARATGQGDAGRMSRSGGNLPRRHAGRTGAGATPRNGANAGPHTDAGEAARVGGSGSGPDYATLRRIRQALKSLD